MFRTPREIAASLTNGQKSTLRSLTRDEWFFLGCGEPTAIRLLKATKSRPPLTTEGPRSPEGYRTFGLTSFGAEVLEASEKSRMGIT